MLWSQLNLRYSKKKKTVISLKPLEISEVYMITCKAESRMRLQKSVKWNICNFKYILSLVINTVIKIGSSDFKVYTYFVTTISHFWFRRGNFTGHVNGKGQKAEDYYVYLREWFILYAMRQGRLLNVRSKRQNSCRKATRALRNQSFLVHCHNLLAAVCNLPN